jgi:hypothetical protein
MNRMADEKPTLHIDTDWKKQAQEEKRRLAEQEKQKAAAPPPGGPTGMSTPFGGAAMPAGEGARTAGAPDGPRSGRDMPPASFAGIVSQIMTQTLFYLGELAPRGSEPVINLDMAKHHIDTLAVLEEKTHGNLTEDEKRMLDNVLYEVRMRYVSTASQHIT